MPRGDTGLFNDVDRQSAGLTGYSKGGKVPKKYQQMQERAISTGAVDSDGFVQLPTPGYQPAENNHRARSNLPSVSQHHHHHPPDHLPSAHLPEASPDYEDYEDSSRLSLADEHSGHLSSTYPVSHDHHSSHQHHHHQHQQHEKPEHSGHLSSTYPVSHDHHSSHQHQQHEKPEHSGHLSHSYPTSHDHHSSHQHHQHQQHEQPKHHQHNHHHNHHNHEKVVETYDPRWWYMPLNHVHSPKSLRLPEYHYLPPKWYESPRTYGKILKNANELRLPPRKYIDCQCHVCKPPQRHIHGVRWVVNQ